MVVAGKIFRITEHVALSDLASRLSNHKKEEHYEEADYKFNLITEVVHLIPRENSLRGVYSHDHVARVFHRGKTLPLPRTIEALFSISQHPNGLLVTVVEKKRLANFVANRLSEVIFEKAANIVEARISPETLRDFHVRNPEDTKITFFDNIDIPNINKLSLYGPNLIGTTLFEEYGKHGDLWYIVARVKKYGYVVGLTRDASVTVFNALNKGKFMEYVEKEIYPLVS